MPTALAANAAEALLARGRTAEAAALIDPLTTGPPDRDHWLAHESRAEIDLLRGDIDAATRRQQQINAIHRHAGSIDLRLAEAAAGRGAGAVGGAARRRPPGGPAGACPVHGRGPDDLLRAAAGGGHARLRRPGRAGPGAPRQSTPPMPPWTPPTAWPRGWTRWPVPRSPTTRSWPRSRPSAPPGTPSGPGWPGQATPPRGTRPPRPGQDLGCPHRAGYAWWRQAEAQLDAGQPAAAAAAALRAAAAAADGHAPLLAQIRALAQRARIPLHPPPDAATEAAAAGRCWRPTG